MSREQPQWAIKQHLEKYPRCEWLCPHVNTTDLGEREGEGVKYFKDGDQWCAVLENFTNLQESPAGFGDTRESALNALRLEI